MFTDDDPLLGRVRGIALGLPDAAEKVSHGRPAFFTKKIFADCGASVRAEGEWMAHDHSVVVMPDADDAPALRDDPRVFVPAYLGAYGWLGLNLDARSDWDEVAELLDASYRLTAPKRAVAALDAITDGP